MKAFKKSTLFIMLAALMVFTAACGNGEEGGDGEQLEGSVVIDGSGTVYPLMARLSENYMGENENVSVEVGRAGSSAGFKKFLTEGGGTDLSNASRKIKEEEKAKAEKLGIEYKELKLALDGITIVVNKDNDWIDHLTQEEVIDIFLASANKEKWSDVRSDFPDEKIKAYGPNENHGTYEFFYETILEEQELRDDINLQQEYSTLVDMVSKDKNAIAYFGYGYYENNNDKLKAVKIDFGNGPVEPSIDTIKEDGEYAPFTRPVFTYLNEKMAKEKAQVLDFAIYAMENAGDVAKETGFAPLPEEEYAEAVEYLEGLK
ncbi:PstS family phosphate ABC transporter substrate-binding protein [Pseudalkalibacillus sp. SCS-8]|uniref:PstS family phosphate ABC transporter substrate-binding protein n=1 Tax=Pseudalkalibacillus nanhaiensis TaxID=3115291 RepID=UPI0032DA5BAD